MLPTRRIVKSWQARDVLRSLGHAALGVFRVHQFSGGLSAGPAALCEVLVERTAHYARMIDPKWLRSTKLAG